LVSSLVSLEIVLGIRISELVQASSQSSSERHLALTLSFVHILTFP